MENVGVSVGRQPRLPAASASADRSNVEGTTSAGSKGDGGLLANGFYHSSLIT